MRLRLAFMGTPEFAVPSLAGLIEAGHEIAAVYTQPPRAAGRGHRLQPSPIAAFASSRGLMLRWPAGLRDAQAQGEFAALGLDLAVVVAYGLLLPEAILAAPRLGCLNLHASLLPRWRGAAPIERAIQAGDAETGLTVMLMDEGLDTGPILCAHRIGIAAEETGGSLTKKLAALGRTVLPTAVEAFAAGGLRPVPQAEEGVTYAAKLTRAQARLDWTKPAEALEREVRAFDPWPGSWFRHGDERIKVLKAELAEGSAAPGTVIGPGLAVACGRGALRLLILQRPGRAALPAEALLRGYAIPAGTRLLA